MYINIFVFDSQQEGNSIMGIRIKISLLMREAIRIMQATLSRFRRKYTMNHCKEVSPYEQCSMKMKQNFGSSKKISKIMKN